MTSTWSKQQTEASMREFGDLRDALNYRNDTAAQIAAYRAEKLAARKQHDAHVLDWEAL